MQLKSYQEHDDEVKKLQQALKDQKGCVSLKSTVASNTLRNKKQSGPQLDFSNLNQVLELNGEESWIVVEPRITFSELCKYTLAQGYVPLVVPEFSTITVGGAIMGAAIESSSHKYGQFNDTCLEFECLLGDGSLLTASPTENHDLFYGLSGSYGTLALLTKVKLRIKPSKPYVNLSFVRYDNFKSAANLLTATHAEDFIEGVAYSSSHIVVAKGTLSDLPQGKRFTQKHPWSCWYVQHLKKTTENAESMPLYDYLFRFDRGAFWMGRFVRSPFVMAQLLFKLGIPKVAKGSYSPGFLFRFLFGWALSSKKLYEFWHRVPTSIAGELFFIHDFYAPSSKASEILAKYSESTGIFPIWLCPVKATPYPQILSPHHGGSNFLNLGFYGIPHAETSIPNLSAKLEKEIFSLGGRKMLYSLTYYDEATFWQIYPKKQYEELRQKYHAENALPNLYEKIVGQ